jgi:DNA-binding CsgD family transcriptional regulator
MSSRTPQERAFSLTETIYAAAYHPPAWNGFLEALARELGGASIAMSVLLPGWNLPSEYYRVNLSEEYVPAFERHFRLGLPWPMTDPLFQRGFAHGRALFPDEKVAETGYYRDYMQPQGMAPEGPLAHLMLASGGRPMSGISIQRMEGGRPFDDDDVAMCNLLVPHLATAHAVRNERLRVDRARSARAHILDRLRVGIVILDIGQRMVVANTAAQRMLDAADGLLERGGIIHASRQRDEQELQRMIRAAIHSNGGDMEGRRIPGGPNEGSFLAISRPSGKASYALVVMRVFASPKLSAVGDEVAAIMITDPAPGESPHADTFRDLFGLTAAEAEVVSLLAAGHSLDEISEQRGVKLGTTRTLLKRVYAKTRANRQGEIIRLVLAGNMQLATTERRSDEEDGNLDGSGI